MFDYERTFWDNVLTPWYRVRNRFKDIKHTIDEFFIKLFRGYSNEEWYSFFSYQARYCIPRLYHLKNKSHGHPAVFCDWEDNGNSMWESKEKYDEAFKRGDVIGGGEKAWKNILDEMILGFTYIVAEDFGKYTKLEKKLIKEMYNKYGNEWDEVSNNLINSKYHYFVNPNCEGDDDNYSVMIPENDFEKAKEDYKDWDYKGLKTNQYYHNSEINKIMNEKVERGMELFAKYYRNLWD